MKNRIPLILCLSFILMIAFGQSGSDKLQVFSYDNNFSSSDSIHELTIFVIPSKVKYDWSSPRSLYRSLVKNYKRNLFNSKGYLLGHAFMELRSPLIPGRILTGMRSASREEQKQYLRKEGYGLAILGAELEGRLESYRELEHKMDKYSRQGNIAFIRLLINDKSAATMIEFFNEYLARFDLGNSSGAPYGGAFYPRYEGEGAGCSAFVISFLDVAGLMRSAYDDWKIEISIPMDLIGGPYNDNHEVRLRDIRKQTSWADPASSSPSHYEYLELYDPTLMYEWIQDLWSHQYDLEELKAVPVQMKEAKGLVFDRKDISVPENEEMIRERENKSLFIEHYTRISHNTGK